MRPEGSRAAGCRKRIGGLKTLSDKKVCDACDGPVPVGMMGIGASGTLAFRYNKPVSKDGTYAAVDLDYCSVKCAADHIPRFLHGFLA